MHAIFGVARTVFAYDTQGFKTFAVVVLVVTILWLVPVLLAANMTISKGRGAIPGVLLGAILGWVGVAIASILRSEWSHDTAALYRECPFCKEDMRRDAVVCPHCRNDSEPWIWHDELWWFKSDEGWDWLDDDENQWYSYDPQEDMWRPPSPEPVKSDETAWP